MQNIKKGKKAQYATYDGIMTYFSAAIEFFPSRNKGTLAVLHVGICLCMDFEHQQELLSSSTVGIHPTVHQLEGFAR